MSERDDTPKEAAKFPRETSGPRIDLAALAVAAAKRALELRDADARREEEWRKLSPEDQAEIAGKGEPPDPAKHPELAEASEKRRQLRARGDITGSIHVGGIEAEWGESKTGTSFFRWQPGTWKTARGYVAVALGFIAAGGIARSWERIIDGFSYLFGGKQ